MVYASHKPKLRLSLRSESQTQTLETSDTFHQYMELHVILSRRKKDLQMCNFIDFSPALITLIKLHVLFD